MSSGVVRRSEANAWQTAMSPRDVLLRGQLVGG